MCLFNWRVSWTSLKKEAGGGLQVTQNKENVTLFLLGSFSKKKGGGQARGTNQSKKRREEGGEKETPGDGVARRTIFETARLENH